jgi:hypothetical protein
VIKKRRSVRPQRRSWRVSIAIGRNPSTVSNLAGARAEIAALKVGDRTGNCGDDSLRVSRNGGRRAGDQPADHGRLRAYLERAGQGSDIDGSLFHNGRGMDPDAIDRVAAAPRFDRGYPGPVDAPPLSPRRSNTGLSSRTSRAAGHRDPSTTKLYDRPGYNPEKAASYFATY